MRPLSISDAKLLTEFTHMAQKMSDKTLKLEQELKLQHEMQRSVEDGSDFFRETREKSPGAASLKEKLSR